MFDPGRVIGRNEFMRLATFFEGGLLVLAYLLGWISDIDPVATFALNLSAVLWGMAGTAPLYLLFVFSVRSRIKGLEAIRHLLVEKLGPLLDSCRWWEMIYLGLLAGFTEEVLFRGVLQPWIENVWGVEAGLLGSNLLFAMAHWITPMYAVLAGVTGIYLGLSMDFGGERNLAVPVLIHAIYDALAFFALVTMYRRGRGSFF